MTQVYRCCAAAALVGHHSQHAVDSVLNWQPMKLPQQEVALALDE